MFNLASLSFFTMVYFWIAFTLPTALLADTLRLSWQAVTQDTSGQAESARSITRSMATPCRRSSRMKKP
jgi:hypothetical protein